MSPDDQNRDTASDRRDGYFALLRAVEMNTGGPTQSNDQPAAMKRGVLVHNRSMAGYEPDHVEMLIDHARDRGHLFAYRDADGDERVCYADEDGIKSLIAAENHRDEPRTELIEAASDVLNGGE